MLNKKHPAAVVAAAERQFQQHLARGVSYNPALQLQQQMPVLPTTYVERPFQNVYMQQQEQRNNQGEAGPDDSGSSRQNSNGSVKAFACTTCGKGFARRSDLARHGKDT